MGETMWIYLALIAGSNWDSTQSWFYGFLLLVLALSTFAVVLCILEERRTTRTRPTLPSSPTATPESLLSGHMTNTRARATRAGKYLGLVAAGVLVGWMWRDYQLGRAIQKPPYWDVLVKERHDAQHFLLFQPGVGDWNATTCEPVDWQRGEKMKYLSFRQHLGCKDVTRQGYYVFWTDAEGDRLKFYKELTHAALAAY